jgi:hypothetical protein
MEQLRRSVEQIDNERRSPTQGVVELPRENATPRKMARPTRAKSGLMHRSKH